MSMDWLDGEEVKKQKKEEKRKEEIPAEWKEIEALEQDIREDNAQLAIVEQRAELKPAPNNATVKADQLGMPRLCDQCYLIDKCPHYKQGSSCYFRNQVKIENPQSLLELTKLMLELQGERVLFGSFIEKSEGSYLDANLSKEMKLMMDLMKDFKELISAPQDEISIKIKGSAASKGNDDGGGGKQGGGILSEIFGGGK
jgi:hypothetical protein